MDRANGLEHLHVQSVNCLKSFFSKCANGAYHLYGVDKNRPAMLTLFNATCRMFTLERNQEVCILQYFVTARLSSVMKRIMKFARF